MLVVSVLEIFVVKLYLEGVFGGCCFGVCDVFVFDDFCDVKGVIFGGLGNDVD